MRTCVLALALRQLLFLLVTVMRTAAAAKGLEEDLRALIAVVRANPSFNISGSWTGHDPCGMGWVGVGCSGFRVVGLSLAGNMLNGTIPPELGKLGHLQSLFLSQNMLSGTIPPELGKLSQLQDLILCDNMLTGPIPPELEKLGQLKELDASNNTLSGSIPPQLSHLNQLEFLILSYNQLSDARAFVGNVRQRMSLGRLDLDENPLRPFPADVLLNKTLFPSLTNVAFTTCRWRSPEKYVHNFCSQTSTKLYSGKCTCQLQSPLRTVAIMWGTWAAVSILALVVLWLVARSAWGRSRHAAGPATDVTILAVLKYMWGLIATGILVLDYVTDVKLLFLLSRSWVRLVILLLVVAQHVISGHLLFWCCLRSGAWPLGLGQWRKKIRWVWDWRCTVLAVQSVDHKPVGLAEDIEADKCSLGKLSSLLGGFGSLHLVSSFFCKSRPQLGVDPSDCKPASLGESEGAVKCTWSPGPETILLILFAGPFVTLGIATVIFLGTASVIVLGLASFILLGLPSVIFLDVCSVLALKLGLQLHVDNTRVDFSHYWDARNLSQIFFQSIPQAIFQSVLLNVYLNPTRVSRDSPSSLILSIMLSLSSVVSVIAMLMWEHWSKEGSQSAFAFLRDRLVSYSPYTMETSQP